MNDKPHVVGVVGNDIVSDSRVKKTAATMAAAGYRSTILCYTGSADRESMMGDVTVRRVHVPWVAMRRFGRVPNTVRPFSGVEFADRHLGRRTAMLAKKRELEAEAAVGEGRRAALFANKIELFVRWQFFRVRRRGHVTVDRVIRKGYLWRTRVLNKVLPSRRDPIGQALDYEVVFGPVLEELAPDIIHAHDVHMIGVAVNAARRLRGKGHQTKVIYDAHELISGLDYPDNIVDAWLELEARFIHKVDAVIGVSDEQVELIAERYGLDVKPKVVHNAPIVGDVDRSSETLSDTVRGGRILVYHGNVGRTRGVFTLVEAIPNLPADVQVVFVAPPKSPVVVEIEELAEELGVADRVHVRDFVPAESLPRYLASAAIEIIPLHRTGNCDISLPNKLFEAIQADLPVLSSDMRSLTRFHREHPIGLVFEEQNPTDLAAKATEMLDDLETYRGAITDDLKQEASWGRQADVLVGVCDDLLGRERSHPVRIDASSTLEPQKGEDWGDYKTTQLAIGPRNMAGQAFAIARAVEDHLGVPALSMALDNGRFDFPADRRITKDAWVDPGWQTHQVRLLSSTCTHVLTESGTGIYGALSGGFVDEQLAQMRYDDLRVAVLFHGSEIRDPARHRNRPFSPYATDAPLINDLEDAGRRLREHLEPLGYDVPFFVTTPDLLQDVADALWLPVVLDSAPWAALQPAFERELPVVLHMPTNGLLKGSDYVDEVLYGLEAEGHIRYLRPTEVQPGDVPGLVEQADIVIDGIVLGAYGLMSVQVMAAGRIAVASIDDIGSVGSACPIVDADPSTLEQALRDLLDDRDSWPERADAGRAFVAEYHDGRFSANQLAPFLGR